MIESNDNIYYITTKNDEIKNIKIILTKANDMYVNNNHDITNTVLYDTEDLKNKYNFIQWT